MGLKRLKRLDMVVPRLQITTPPPETCSREGPDVVYVYSRDATIASGTSPTLEWTSAPDSVLPDLLPVNNGKTERTHALASAYGLLHSQRIRLVVPQGATEEQLMEFHDSDYLQRLADSRPEARQRPQKHNIFGMKMRMDSPSKYSAFSIFSSYSRS